MEIQDIDEIELSMPPRSHKGQHVQKTSRAKSHLMVSLFVLVNYYLIDNVDGQLMRMGRLQSRMVQKRSDRASPALRGLLDTLLEPTRTASSSNGWKGFVFMDPLFKVQRSPSSSASVIQPSVPSSPSFPMDSPQYETESAPIPYIIEPPVDMYQPMASNTRYSTAKRPYDDYYDDDDNGEPIPRVRSRKVKPVTTTTKKPNPTPAISIGPASGGGTAIRLGKAKITFKKGSISLGPVEDHEAELKKSSNIDKSTKRPYHNYGDETEANDYIGTSSRNQGSDRHQNNRDLKDNLDSRPVYSEDDYGPKYAANYKTSATGYYQSYKPYHNLDTLMDKQVNPNQGHRASLNEHSSNYSPQPVYKGNSKSSAVTETYLTKGDYDYEDSVVTELSSRKKTRGKRRDETVVEDDEENNEDKEPTVGKMNEKREKRKKNGNSKSNKKDFESDEDESKLTTETDDEPEDIDLTTEKISSSTSTPRPSRKKSKNKPKSQPNSSTPNPKVTSSRTNRNKAKIPKTTAKPDDSVSMDEEKLTKEHRTTESDSTNHDNDDEEENGESIEIKKADSEDEVEEEKPSRLTTITTPVTVTTKASESKRRKSNSRQNVRRKNNNNRSSISTPKSTIIQLDDGQSSKSNVDTVYIGNRGQTIKTVDQSKSKKASIESVSILPEVGTPSDRGTIVTLKMSDDPSLGVIGSSSNSRKPGTIYQIRLTSKIPTEPAIVTKIAEDNGSVDIGKDENSLNRLIKMMQETLEDIRKSQSSSLLPSTISSSPCPPSKINSQVIIEPIPTTQKPSLIISTLKASTPPVKPLVDPFLNLHHGNITVVPASMGNVSDIVDMLVKTSKMVQPSVSEKIGFSPSITDKTPMIKESTSEVNDNSEDKKSGTSDNFSIDLDGNNQSINSSDRPQAEESRTKGMTQNFNQQSNIDDNSDQNESKRQISNTNNDNSDDVPIIVVLLPPEDDIGKGTIN